MTKNLPDSERTEKIVAYLSGAAFDFYFDGFTLETAPTEEAKDYGEVSKVMLEKFCTQKTESEIMREALTLLTMEEIFRTSYQGLARSAIRLKSQKMSYSIY